VPRSKGTTNFENADGPIRGAELEPLRVVRRELVSPTGSVVVVDVPVYPPFRLQSERERAPRRGAPRRAAAAATSRDDSREPATG